MNYMQKKGNAFDLGDLKELKLNEISGIKKIAILLITLGPEISQKVLKTFSEEQVKRISEEIVSINSVNAQERKEVLSEFIERNKAKDYVIEGGYDYAKNLLIQSFGEEKANLLLRGIKESKTSKPFEKIKKANINELYVCIKEESTQTIAIILSNIESHKASQLLLKFPEELHSEILINMGTLSKVSPIILKTIEDDINSKLSNVDKNNDDKLGGVSSLVEILGQVGRRAEKNILTKIQEENSLLAEQIKANMFVFEDISKLDDRTVQRILRDVDIRVLSFALKSVSSEIAEIIYRNQSERATQTLKEEIELLGPVQIVEVENAQQEIVNVIRALEEKGEIKIIRGANDAFVE